MNNIKASIFRVSALHHATADVAVRASIPRHEGRKPRAESRARYPNPGFLPNRTLAMFQQTRKSPIPVPPIPDWAGNRGGNPRFPIRPGTGIGVPIWRAGDFLVWVQGPARGGAVLLAGSLTGTGLGREPRFKFSESPDRRCPACVTEGRPGLACRCKISMINQQKRPIPGPSSMNKYKQVRPSKPGPQQLGPGDSPRSAA